MQWGGRTRTRTRTRTPSVRVHVDTAELTWITSEVDVSQRAVVDVVVTFERFHDGKRTVIAYPIAWPNFALREERPKHAFFLLRW